MLNLFDKKTKNSNHDISKLNFFKKNSVKGEQRHSPPATKEWFNSIYSYNKNFIKTLPIVDKIVNKFIKSYFNLTPLFNNKKSSRVQVRFKRLSLNRILVSRAEMKHTNNKVIITVYLYNKNKKFFMYKLKKLYKTFIFRVRKKLVKKTKKINRNNKPLYKPLMGRNINGYYSFSGFVTTLKPIKPKFNSKRFKKNKPNFKVKFVKTNQYMNFTNLTLKFLPKLALRMRNKNKRNQYITLINKYYLLFGNNELNTMNNENYFLNYVNLAKAKSSVNSNQNVYKRNLITSLNKKTSIYKTKRTKNLHKFLSVPKKRFPFTFALSKTRKSREVKNFIYRLRNLHRLFIRSNMYRFNNLVLKPQVKNPNLLIKNLVNILKNKSGLIKKMDYIAKNALTLYRKARKNKKLLYRLLGLKKHGRYISYQNKFYLDFISKSYRKEILYLYYVKMLSVNNNKFKNWFINGLKRIISVIYNKKVEFNLVNLKYLHLNSDIFSQSIAIKLRNRENRLLRVLKKALKLVKMPSLRRNSFFYKKNSKSGLPLNVNGYISRFKHKDILHELLYKIFPGIQGKIEKFAYSHSKNTLQKNILNSTKYKNIYGVRLEAHGRLSRRLTASRSIFKLKYKGSLRNIGSSYKSLGSVILRGNTRSNIQLTKITSKTRNGSFGLKGWISSY